MSGGCLNKLFALIDVLGTEIDTRLACVALQIPLKYYPLLSTADERLLFCCYSQLRKCNRTGLDFFPEHSLCLFIIRVNLLRIHVF